MKRIDLQQLDQSLLLDCSQKDQVNFLAKTFNVSPQAVKTAVRACCDNSVAAISAYLKNTYSPAVKQNSAANGKSKGIAKNNV